MIQVTPQMRIRVAVEPADFRKGIDGLARLCREALGSDPFSGSVFVFGNKSRKAVKILVYDGQGFWLCQKRLVAAECLRIESDSASPSTGGPAERRESGDGPRRSPLASGGWSIVRKDICSYPFLFSWISEVQACRRPIISLIVLITVL